MESARGFRAQEHAPTVETCRADVALWYSDEMAKEYLKAETAWLTDGVPNRTEVAKLPILEATERADEMRKCSIVDKRHQYFEAVDFYNGVIKDRFFDFVKRHPDLMKQMVQEDAQGLR